jgi:diguanylate cyclase (GGDEF)-like protein
VLPNTKLDDAERLAERLRAAIDQADFSVVGHITGSFGLARFREDDELVKLLNRAAAALYRAKRAGRSCIQLDRQG